MAAHYQSLRDRQVGMYGKLQDLWPKSLILWLASIEKILNLNETPSVGAEAHHDPTVPNGLIPKSTPILNADGQPIWKVLVFDNLGRDVISSVLRVNDLRGWGVTIHL
jgi:sec1 family domain-containing protein 1